MSPVSRRQFTILTACPRDETVSRLMEAIGPPPTLFSDRTSRPFTGQMRGDSFRVMRASRGRQSFRPLIQGTVEASPGGSRVTGTMRLHGAVIAFTGFLIVVPAFFLLQMLRISVATGRWDASPVVFLGAIAFLVAMVWFASAIENRRALRELARVVDGDVREGDDAEVGRSSR